MMSIARPEPTTPPTPSATTSAEMHLRAAARHLEHAGVIDLEWHRLSKVVFRLAQRVAVDSGRLVLSS